MTSVPPARSGPGDQALLRAEIRDLEERLESAERRGRRHLLWCVLGISPAALIPLAGLVLEGSAVLVVVLVLLVFVVEGFRWARAAHEAATLEDTLREYRKELQRPGGGAGENPSARISH